MYRRVRTRSLAMILQEPCIQRALVDMSDSLLRAAHHLPSFCSLLDIDNCLDQSPICQFPTDCSFARRCHCPSPSFFSWPSSFVRSLSSSLCAFCSERWCARICSAGVFVLPNSVSWRSVSAFCEVIVLIWSCKSHNDIHGWVSQGL